MPLLYDGDMITVVQGEGAWIPVVAGTGHGNTMLQDNNVSQVVFPREGCTVEAVPGLWEIEQYEWYVMRYW